MLTRAVNKDSSSNLNTVSDTTLSYRDLYVANTAAMSADMSKNMALSRGSTFAKNDHNFERPPWVGVSAHYLHASSSSLLMATCNDA